MTPIAAHCQTGFGCELLESFRIDSNRDVFFQHSAQRESTRQIYKLNASRTTKFDLNLIS